MLANTETAPSGLCVRHLPRGSRPLFAVIPFAASGSEARIPHIVVGNEEVDAGLCRVCAGDVGITAGACVGEAGALFVRRCVAPTTPPCRLSFTHVGCARTFRRFAVRTLDASQRLADARRLPLTSGNHCEMTGA